MNVRERLQKARRWLRRTGTWLRHEVPKAPAMEVYARHVDRDAVRLSRRLQQDGPAGFASYITPYLDQDIPRILWIYWAQGEDGAPPTVARCIASWRQHNPSWDIRVLDDTTLGDVVNLSDMPTHLPFVIRADLLRLRLLAQHGGVWADATVLCHRPLDDWMPLLGGQTGFFVFSAPHSDRWLSSWFIAARPCHPLITGWRDAYGAFVTRLRHQPTKYFMVMYTMQWALIRNRALMQHWRRRGSLPAVPCFLLQAAWEDRHPSVPAFRAIAHGLPVSKLSWKSDAPPERLDKLLGTCSDLIS